MHKGLFVVIEGPDGTGKTTQARLLAERLDHHLIPHELTREPDYSGDEGERIRRILRGQEEVGPLERQELFVKNRKWHVNVIINPALLRGKVVISDRYFLSTIAYGSSNGIDPEVTMQMNAEFPLPDLIIILSVPIEVCLARLDERNKASGHPKELFEEEELLRKAEGTYQMLAKKYPNVIFVDGTGSEELVSDKIMKLVLPMIGEKEETHARADSATAAA